MKKCNSTTAGVIFRMDCKSTFINHPPLKGEMVFALDTGEHGWLNELNVLTWKDLSIDEVGDSGELFEVCASPHIFTEASNWETL